MTTSKFDRHIFCIDGKRQIEGTSGGIGMYGADNVEVQIDYVERIEAERAAEKIAQEELARIVRNHAASRTSKQ